jgi:CRISPR-associated protein Csx14
MSIYGMVTAQILFDDNDRLWHLVSEEALVKSRRLFPEPGDSYSLVPIPVIRSTDVSPLLTPIIQAETPQAALREQEIVRQDQRLELFLKTELTKTEQILIKLMAQGLSNKEIVTRQQVKPNTVEKQLNKIYSKWRAFRGLNDEAQPRGQIVAELSGYLLRRGGQL